MTSRITFLLITLFWLTMTYLLWRTEYVGHNQVGSNVPLELVWRKILTAPDTSNLEISHEGRKMGYGQWHSNIGEDVATGKLLTDDAPPDGMVQQPTGYQLNFEGGMNFNDAPGRLKLNFDIKLSKDEAWQEFNLKVLMKRTADYEIHSRASEQTVHVMIGDKEGRSERVLKFAELQNPQALLEEFGAPGGLAILGELGPPPSAKSPASLLPTVHWTARNDWISIGHTSVRAYRLEASVLDRYRMLIIVSTVGEIVRVELPDGWEMINTKLLGL